MAQVVGDHRWVGSRPSRAQRVRDPPVQQSPPGEARLAEHQRPHLPVGERVAGVGARLLDESVRGQCLERLDGLLLAAAARLPQGVEVEDPADHRPGADDLTGALGQRRQAGAEDVARAARQSELVDVAGAAHGSEVLDREQWQSFAVGDHTPREFVRRGRLGRADQLRHVGRGQPAEADARGRCGA